MNQAPVTPPVSRGLKVLFSIGSTGQAMVYTGVTSFVLIFYNQVKGLPPNLVGLAFSAGLMMNAFMEPLVGSWSDRTRSRLGRRHPFMFAAIVPVALCVFGLFNPPAALRGTGLLVWMTVINLALWQALSVFGAPHIALGGEMSDSYVERSKIMSWNTFCLWLGDSLSWVLGFGVFFRASAAFPNGALDATRYPRFSLAIALMVAAFLAVSAWFTRGRIPYLPQPGPAAGSFRPAALFSDVLRALSNRNYRMLLFGSLGYTLMSGVRNGLNIYAGAFFWRLTSNQLALFVIASFIGYLFASSIVARLHARLEKRWTNVGAVLFNVVVPAIPLTLGLAGMLKPSTPHLLVVLIAFAAFGHMGYSLMTTTLNSAVADIADENELRYGVRQEGILYSTRTFFMKLDQALGTAMAGWALAFIAFPLRAKVGQVPPETLQSLALAFVLSGLPALLGLVFFARYGVTRETYAVTRAALLERRTAANPAR